MKHCLKLIGKVVASIIILPVIIVIGILLGCILFIYGLLEFLTAAYDDLWYVNKY